MRSRLLSGQLLSDQLPSDQLLSDQLPSDQLPSDQLLSDQRQIVRYHQHLPTFVSSSFGSLSGRMTRVSQVVTSFLVIDNRYVHVY